MKILLLHPEDAFAHEYSKERWDLVVDLGRAPRGTYEDWGKQAGCRVISIYDYAEEIDDLYYLRELLQLGIGRVVDQWGIDWWDIFSLEIASGIQRAVLVERLSKGLPLNCDLYSTRVDPVATALQRLLGGRVTCLGSRMQSMGRRLRRRYETFSQLGGTELLQLFEDKFDADHAIRRRFAGRRPKCRATRSAIAVCLRECDPDRARIRELASISAIHVGRCTEERESSVRAG